jgi:hypothetical protein
MTTWHDIATERQILTGRSSALDVNDQRMLLSGFTTIADRGWKLARELKEANFDVIWPRVHFEMSFGSEQERGDYERYLLEIAKARVCSPNTRYRLPEGGP